MRTRALALFTCLATAACSGSGEDAPGGTGARAVSGAPGTGGAGVGGAASGGISGSTLTGGINGPAGAGTTSTGAVAGASAVGGGGTGGSSMGGAAGASAGAPVNGGSSNAGSASVGGGLPSGGASAGSGGSSAGSAGAGGASTGCAGRALSLSANGTGTDSDAAYSRVTIDLGTALPTGNAKRTIEFWAFIQSSDWVGEKNEIYYFGGSSGTEPKFGLDFATNPVMGMTANHATLNPFTGSAFNVDSTADLGLTSSTDQWVHIAMTWDGSALRTYVNGKLGITSTGNGSTTMLGTAQGPLVIGCNPENKGCFNGLFDEFRLWNVARSEAELMANYQRALSGSEPGLVGYWKFDDAPGSSTAADSVVGQTTHAGALEAAMESQKPTFVDPTPALPLMCP